MVSDTSNSPFNMGSNMEGDSTMENREKQPIKMVHMYIHLQHSRNLANHLHQIFPKKTNALKSMRKVVVNDKMQSNYTYYLVEPIGKNFDSDFKPELTPKEMLALGVFGGKYMTDCKDEFPDDWFKKAKLSPEKKDTSINYFGVDASMPLSHWKKKGWIYHEDPRGWFQWYCRYYMGRRIPPEDERQIKRWKAMRRHVGAIRKNCLPQDLDCRRKQRQALLHWAYDSRGI